MNLENILNDFILTYVHPWVIVWIILEVIIILIIVFLFKKLPKSSFVIFFDMFYEKVYEFFEELLWIEERKRIKTYVTLLFFIIVFSNLLGVFLEFFLPIFGHWMEHFIKIPTADINFNIAMAIIWVLVVIIEQFRFLWAGHFIYEYFPIFWKDYIPYTRWALPKAIDYPVYILVKIFDIIISLFLWLLEIIWLFAKIISLSFRLFWNVTSGWLLLTMLVWALTAATAALVNVEFPVLIPLIVYIQELLVALIQAFVFPLLIAIFIKVAKLH
jgi:F0F1-type ATP synthase membrane subunit a